MPRFNRGRTSPKIIVSGVVRTGRFRLRPGRWWECQTFIVEIEELISYANLQDFMPEGPPAKVWRRGNMSDMLNCPCELFDPRAMDLQEDIDAATPKIPVVLKLKVDTKQFEEYLERVAQYPVVYPPGEKISTQPGRDLVLSIRPGDLQGFAYGGSREEILARVVGMAKTTWPNHEIYTVQEGLHHRVELWRRPKDGVS